MPEVAAVFSLVGLIATGKQAVNWVKYVRARDWNSVITQAVSWALGIGLMLWASIAKLMAGIVLVDNDPRLGTVTIGSLDGGSLAFAGVALGSIMSAVYDNAKAKDNTQSAATPPLIPDATADPSPAAPAAPAPSPVYLSIVASTTAAPAEYAPPPPAPPAEG